MAKHDKPAIGLWSSSDNYEEWPDGPYCDTREEAAAEGRRYVGRVTWTMTPDVAADATIRSRGEAQDWLDHLEVHTCEGDLLGKATRGQLAELRGLVADWYRRHNLVNQWSTIGSSECAQNKPSLAADEEGSILFLALLTAAGLAVLILAGTPWGWA